MFRRRPGWKMPSLTERLERLRQAGFATSREPDGRMRVSGGASVAIVEGSTGDPSRIPLAG